MADVHAVDLDAAVARLEGGVHAVVDHESDGILEMVPADLVRDAFGHQDDLRDVGVLGAQLDETRAAVECLGHHVEQRAARAVVGADDEVEAQVERTAH